MAIEPGIWQARPHARHLGTDVGHFLRQLDYLMLAAVAGLVAYGLWIVQAVTRDDVAGNPDYFLVRQGIYVGIGVVALGVMTALDPELLRRWRYVLFGVTIALILAVYALGDDVRGSRRWIDLGFFQLQPSEIGKIAFIVLIAGVPRRPGAPDRPRLGRASQRWESRPGRSCSSSSSRTSARPSSGARRSRGCCTSPASAGCTSPSSRWRSRPWRWPCSGSFRTPGSKC